MDAVDTEPPHAAPKPLVRRAGPQDAAALVRLRALMLDAMGTPAGPPEAPWRQAAHEWFVRRLAEKDEFAAFVVEDRHGRVISSAVGSCDHHAPGPANPSGRYGYLSNVSTDPAFRGRGCARACVEAVLRWFAEDTPVRMVNLNTTAGGQGLYTRLGFAPPAFPALQARLSWP